MSIKITFSNPRALEAVVKIIECFESVVEDMPWRDDVKEAIEELKYIAFSVQVSGDRGKIIDGFTIE